MPPATEPPGHAAPAREADHHARAADRAARPAAGGAGAVTGASAAGAGGAGTARGTGPAARTGNAAAWVEARCTQARAARIARAARAAGRTAAAAGPGRLSATTRPARAGSRTPRVAGRMRRRAGVAVVTGLAVVAAVLLSAGAAQATGYRYWSYWLRSGGAWTYAQTGPAMHIPDDGDVEGWRFGVSQDAAVRGVLPRGTADFAAICGGTPAAHGMKRVALVIDPGTAADAPGGSTPPARRTACARVDTGASSADALAAVARPLRYDSAGVLCAIAGYPQAGCGDQVASSSGSGSGSGASADAGTSPSPSPAASSSASGEKGGVSSVGIYAGLAAVLALAAAAAWQTRRRRR